MKHIITQTFKFFSFFSLICSAVVYADTLEDVKKAGILRCGISGDLPGFSYSLNRIQYHGLDTDICRAVAAAVLGDANKVKFVTLDIQERFKALQEKKIDILSRNTSLTITRDTTLGFHFAGVSYFEGQGVMVSKKSGIQNLQQLDGITVCAQKETTAQKNLNEYFSKHSLKYNPIYYETQERLITALKREECGFITADFSKLYAILIEMEYPNDYKILPDVIAKEPFGPFVREGDDTWYNIVKWSLNLLKAAEELGITSQNVVKLEKESKNLEIQKILGTTGYIGENLQLDARWGYNMIKQVGNYDEIFQRNLGKNSPFNMSRGLNHLWTTKGGLHYSAPFR